jgi:hypothetical protein
VDEVAWLVVAIALAIVVIVMSGLAVLPGIAVGFAIGVWTARVRWPRG